MTARQPHDPTFLHRPRLIAITVGLAVAETAAIWALGVETALGLSPQISAPPPFGVFHDLRWLLVYHRSWWTFAAGIVVLLLGRSLITTLIVREAWPTDLPGRPRPAFAVAYRHALGFTLLAVILMAPWALLLFGLAVVPLSWLFFTAVPPAIVIALLIHHGAIGSGWWRRPPPLRTVGWVLVTFLELTAAAAFIRLAPPAARIPVAALAGLFNGWAWFGIVQGVVRREPAHHRHIVPVAPLGVVAMLAVVVIGAAVGFSVVTGQSKRHPNVGGTPDPAGRPVLVVNGFESTWDGTPANQLGSGFDTRRFSYRGTSGSGVPLPYDGTDTEQSLPHLDALMAQQVGLLHAATGKPVAVVAESEGALVAKTYLLSHPGAPVNRFVMLSPLVHPGRVYYPPAGEQGWGVATAVGLKGITQAMGALSPFTVSPDGPLLRSIVDEAPSLVDMVGCPIPGTRQLVVAPIADSVGNSGVNFAGVPVVVVPAFHGGLLGDASVRSLVRKMLVTGQVPSDSLAPADRVVSAASSAWQVPSLPLSLRPGEARSPENAAPNCTAISAALQGWATSGASGR